MTNFTPTTNELFKVLRTKGALKQEVFGKTLEAFNLFKIEAEILAAQYMMKSLPDKPMIPFEYYDRGEFEFRMKFGADVLIYMMHTNVFEFSRDHEVMRNPYVKDDKRRSYCGIIHIFNFLADSFKYNRTQDIGYLIGRIFVNREHHYFIEGKREVGLLYNNFPTSKMNRKAVQNIIRSAMLYTINFDLLTPPYNSMKEVTVLEIQTALDAMQIRTGKRMGFRFEADES
ncbi:MAG: hypothetical protein D4R67_06975 [Bacteroidetes bacterium]|nr:MAG: hypothetical protein D4R67_06975 [Bacteroidota bacterium]